MASFLDTLFPNADATQALGLLGTGMMSGNAAGGFQAALGLLSPENKLKRDLLQMQVDNYKSEIASRQAGLQKQQQLQDLLKSAFGGHGETTAPAAPGQIGSGSFGIVASPASQPAVPQMASAGGSRIGSMNPDMLALLKANGLDLVDVAKLARPDMQVSNGFAYDKNSVRPGFLPQLNISQNGQASLVTVGSDGMPIVSMPQGAALTTAQNTLASKLPEAVVNSAATTNLRPDAAGRQMPVNALQENPTLQSMFGSLFGGAPAVVPPAAGRSAVADPSNATRVQPGDADRVNILRQELTASQQRLAQLQTDPRTTPEIMRRAQSDVNELQKQLAPYGQPSQPGVKPGGPYGPASSQTKLDESWIKGSFEPTIAAGNTARDLADTVNVTRQAMLNMGSTGWGTQAKAAGAAVLSGLGIAPKNAEMYAANAQVFQKTAMDRLWSTLNEAKGPQTEGDADRAAKTYASLANTPQANAYILDLAQARAERDLMKARFYQQAMPMARDRGDLTEVDREWAKRAPSIFAMPSMKPWTGGVK